VAHTCNPSYSGGRDQVDCSSKPALANSLMNPLSKKSITKKRAGGVLKVYVNPEFKSQFWEKKKKGQEKGCTWNQPYLKPKLTSLNIYTYVSQ
jgi:hypothetical protein